MTSRNQIWKRANDYSEARCISMLKLIFPSLSYDFISTESGIIRTEVATKKDALNKIRLGLTKITEVEADYYISVLNQKKKTTQIKF
jgi:hypothetical protein